MTGVEFEAASGERFTVEADMVLKAIGQTLVPDALDAALLTADGTRIAVDADGRTAWPDVWAGGDCAATGGVDLTVQAVQDGKRAAASIDATLAQRREPRDRATRVTHHEHNQHDPTLTEPTMADLRCTIAGITSPNPFWLASAPPTDKAYNVNRAFEAGWGGVVWKTLADPHVVNVSSRYGAVQWNGQRIAGLNNIELITDRPLDVNLRDRAGEARLAGPRADRVADGAVQRARLEMDPAARRGYGRRRGRAELRLSARDERARDGRGGRAGSRICGDGHALGEGRHEAAVPREAHAEHQRHPDEPRAAYKGGADGVSLINTINSIVAVDLDHMAPMPTVDGKGTRRLLRPGGQADRIEHGRGDRARPGNAEPADLGHRRHLVMARRGGVHGARRRRVQVCTAAMHYGFRIVSDASGLSNWMDEKGYATLDDIRGRAVPNVTDWKYLNLKYDIKARIGTAASSAGCAISRARTRHAGDHRDEGRRAPLRSGRFGMRRVQSLHACVSGRAMHHDGACRFATTRTDHIRTIRQARTRGRVQARRRAREEGCLTASGEAGHHRRLSFHPGIG